MGGIEMHFTPAKVGNEQVLAAEYDSCRMLFGLGPAGAGEAPEQRCASILDELAPELRAVRWCQQVHSNLIASLADQPGEPARHGACVGRCDGLISAEHGLGLVIWTADCVPVILVGGGVVAAVHSGWRGCDARVVPAAIRRLQVEYGVAPAAITLLIGPAVGACHYQVGPEVVRSLGAQGLDRSRWLHHDRVDLRGFVAAQAERAGVPAAAITPVGACTACDPDLASFRRDGEHAGRQLSMVYRLSGS